MLPSGRSLLCTVPLVACICIWVVTRRIDRVQFAPGFGIGVVSHLVADSYSPVLTIGWYGVQYLLRPLTPTIIYPSRDISPLSRAIAYYSNPTVNLEGIIAVLAILVWASNVSWGALRTRQSCALLFDAGRQFYSHSLR